MGIKKHGHTADFPYYFVLTKFNAKHLACLFVHAIIACEEHFYNVIGISPLVRFLWVVVGGGERNILRGSHITLISGAGSIVSYWGHAYNPRALFDLLK